MGSESASYILDLSTLLTSLPACKRCRKNRRRCDTKLESCENCVKAGVECIYYDHVLQEELPRSYVASLVHYLDQDSDATVSAPERPHLSESAQVSATLLDQKHYYAFSQGSYRYLGAKSPLIELNTLDDLVERRQTTPDLYFPSYADTDCAVISPDLHRYLTRHFTGYVQKIYPILDPSLPWLSSDGMVDLHSSPNEAFLQHMVHAISCRSSSSHNLFFNFLATVSYSRALQCFEKATDDSSISTLQVAVLLVLYTLLDPSSGNLSQQMGFAVRLAIELAGSESEESSPILSTLIKVTYCLENQACGLLDRPASMREPGAPLKLPVQDPLEFLCILYQIQARTRAGLSDDTIHSTLSLLADDTLECIHPNILSTLRETQLMVQPTTSAATRLIAAYSDDRYVPTVLTAHWVFKAASIIVEAIQVAQDELRPELLRGYGNATALLGKWSLKWDVARVLLECLQFNVKEHW